MPQVGIRELKNETSEILRAVREEKAEYVVTHRGKPVAVILPLNVEVSPELTARIEAEAQRRGLSLEAFLEQLMDSLSFLRYCPGPDA
jgi:prevent-host-death family protein